MADNDVHVRVRITKAQLLAHLNAAAPAVAVPCAHCGGKHGRELVGVHWMAVHDDLDLLLDVIGDVDVVDGVPRLRAGTAMKIAGPAADTPPDQVPCAVIACAGCGNIRLLRLDTAALHGGGG